MQVIKIYDLKCSNCNDIIWTCGNHNVMDRYEYEPLCPKCDEYDEKY